MREFGIGEDDRPHVLKVIEDGGHFDLPGTRCDGLDAIPALGGISRVGDDDPIPMAVKLRPVGDPLLPHRGIRGAGVLPSGGECG